jgi:hypothetical protein
LLLLLILFVQVDIDWSKFTVRFPRSVLHGWELEEGTGANTTLTVEKGNTLFARLKRIRDGDGGAKLKAMQAELQRVRPRFLYPFRRHGGEGASTSTIAAPPPQKDDALLGILQELEHRQSYAGTCKWKSFTAPESPQSFQL